MNTPELPHLHSPTSKIKQDTQTSLWSRGMKYVIQIYEGEINRHEKKKGLPTEYQHEFEQQMLKHIHDIKNDLREKGWCERETPGVSQTSFMRGKNSDAELGFKLE